MANVESNITVSGDEDSNIYQRLQQINDELEVLENHKETLNELGYNFEVNTQNGEFLAKVQDQ